MKDAISMKLRVLELFVPASINILGFLVKWDMWYTNSTRISVSFALTTTRVSGFSLSTLFAWNITRVSASSCLRMWLKSGHTLSAATHKRGTWAVLTWMVLRVTLSAIQMHTSVEDLLCCILPHRPHACHAPCSLWMETDRCLWLNQLILTVPTSDAEATHLCYHKSVLYQPGYAAGTWHIPILGHWEYTQTFHPGCWSKPVLPHKWKGNYRHYQRGSSQYPEQRPPVVWGVQKGLFVEPCSFPEGHSATQNKQLCCGSS